MKKRQTREKKIKQETKRRFKKIEMVPDGIYVPDINLKKHIKQKIDDIEEFSDDDDIICVKKNKEEKNDVIIEEKNKKYLNFQLQHKFIEITNNKVKKKYSLSKKEKIQ